MLEWLWLLIYFKSCDAIVKCDNTVDGNSTTLHRTDLTYEEFCEFDQCLAGVSDFTDCVRIATTDENFLRTVDTYFFEFGSRLFFHVEIPMFRDNHKANLTHMYMNFGNHKSIEVYSENVKMHVEVTTKISHRANIIDGALYFNESLLEDVIDGARHDLQFIFMVGDELLLRNLPLVIVGKLCSNGGNTIAAPGTYAQFDCPTSMNLTTDPTAGILRFCSMYGWDDSRSKDYCGPSSIVENTVPITTTEKPGDNAIIIMLGIIITGILLIIAAFLFYIQKNEEVIKVLEESSSEEESSSDSDTSWDPEQGEKEPKTFTAVVNATGGFAAAERPSVNVISVEPPSTGNQGDGKRGPDNFEPPEQGSKKKDFVHELATLAILRDTGNLTQEEFAYSKNLILYE